MNLYQIDREIEACIMSIVDPDTGEVTGEAIDFDRLEGLQLQREEKIEALALWYKNLLSDSEQLKREKEAFAVREKRVKIKAESIKKYLDQSLCGEKFSTNKCIIFFRKSTVVEVDEGAELPNEFLKFKEPEPDKVAIKAAIKNGEHIHGCRIVERQNISIK